MCDDEEKRTVRPYRSLLTAWQEGADVTRSLSGVQLRVCSGRPLIFPFIRDEAVFGKQANPRRQRQVSPTDR